MTAKTFRFILAGFVFWCAMSFGLAKVIWTPDHMNPTHASFNQLWNERAGIYCKADPDVVFARCTVRESLQEILDNLDRVHRVQKQRWPDTPRFTAQRRDNVEIWIREKK